MFGHGREEIIFAGVEEGDVRRGPRRDDAHDFAADEFLARAGLFHLIADRDFESRANQTRDVAFRGVIRYTTHGNWLALFAVA